LDRLDRDAPKLELSMKLMKVAKRIVVALKRSRCDRLIIE
jgi:hypothetical protein